MVIKKYFPEIYYKKFSIDSILCRVESKSTSGYFKGNMNHKLYDTILQLGLPSIYHQVTNRYPHIYKKIVILKYYIWQFLGKIKLGLLQKVYH